MLVQIWEKRVDKLCFSTVLKFNSTSGSIHDCGRGVFGVDKLCFSIILFFLYFDLSYPVMYCDESPFMLPSTNIQTHLEDKLIFRICSCKYNCFWSAALHIKFSMRLLPIYLSKKYNLS